VVVAVIAESAILGSSILVIASAAAAVVASASAVVIEVVVVIVVILVIIVIEASSHSRLTTLIAPRLPGDCDILEADEMGGRVSVHEPKLRVDLSRVMETHCFAFDQAFGEGATTQEVRRGRDKSSGGNRERMSK